MDQHGLNLTFRRQIAQPLKSGSHQRGTAIALVFEDPFRRHLVTAAPRKLDQRPRLARDGALLPLLVRRHPRIDCRDRHCHSPSSLNPRQQSAPGREPAARRPADVCYRADDQVRNQAGLYIDPDATAGQPCPRTAVRKAVIARVTISLSVKPLITEYARTSPTMLPGILSVIGTDGATAGTGWPIVSASCR